LSFISQQLIVNVRSPIINYKILFIKLLGHDIFFGISQDTDVQIP